jgi:RND superfamily putative drug exporter
VWLVTAGVLGLVALNTVNLKADGLPSTDAFKTQPDSLVAQEVIAAHYPGGVGSPVVVIGAADAADEIADVLTEDPGIAEVGAALPVGEQVRIEAVLVDDPESDAALATVERLRVDLDTADETALVGGSTAINLDVRDAATRDRQVIIPLILLVVFVILVLLLRSVVAPAMLIATVVLSFFATLGVMAFLFNEVFGFAGAEPTYPLFAFLFLVALGVDYNIFLMTRVREESQRIGTRAGIIKGLAVTGGVITSAGIVLAATFSILTVLPLVGPTQIGLTVAIGVLIDALIVRSILVPALGLDLGDRLWSPSALRRGAGQTDPTGSLASTTEPPVSSTR